MTSSSWEHSLAPAVRCYSPKRTFSPFPEEAAQSFYGGNPFQLRNAIIQRRDAIAGAIWLAGSLVAVLTGTQWTVHGGEMGYFIGPWADTLVLLAAGIGAWCATIAVTTRLSRRAYLPRMVEKQRKLFEQASSAITHGGCLEEERLAIARGSLAIIGKLIDNPRKADETDREYVERLRPFFRPGSAADEAE